MMKYGKFLYNEDGEKEFFIEGVFMQANQKNRNGRIYPTNVLEREVARYNKEYVEKNRAFGELGHPQGPTINLERVSHMIKSLTKEGDNFIGKAKIMDSPYGNIVKNLIKEGASLGVSSRGMGSLKAKMVLTRCKTTFILLLLLILLLIHQPQMLLWRGLWKVLSGFLMVVNGLSSLLNSLKKKLKQ